MSDNIRFRTPTEFLGRNGQGRMAGILIDRLGDDLTLAPITPRMQVGRAYLLVPLDMVPVVAQAMLRVSDVRPKAVVEVRGGVADLASCTPGVEVESVDHDNLEADKRRVA